MQKKILSILSLRKDGPTPIKKADQKSLSFFAQIIKQKNKQNIAPIPLFFFFSFAPVCNNKINDFTSH
jgi:hypothetical protein